MPDSCGWDTINAWVQAHRDALPTTLAALSLYPMNYRRAIHGAVTLEVRTNLWREHFESFLAPSSTLSAPQQAFLRDTLPELRLIFAADRATAQARMRELEAHMLTLFTPDEARVIFSQLGPDEPAAGISAPL